MLILKFQVSKFQVHWDFLHSYLPNLNKKHKIIYYFILFCQINVQHQFGGSPFTPFPSLLWLIEKHQQIPMIQDKNNKHNKSYGLNDFLLVNDKVHNNLGCMILFIPNQCAPNSCSSPKQIMMARRRYLSWRCKNLIV